MSSRTYLSIGDVLSLLREEFPDVTISKIRFLESQGLVNPERSPSGYRKFFEHDVERLRWVLRQQREHFLPLKVIRDRLSEGDLDDDADLDEVEVEGEGTPKEANGSMPQHAAVGVGAATVGARPVVGSGSSSSGAGRHLSSSGGGATAGASAGPARSEEELLKADSEAMARILADASRRAALMPESAKAGVASPPATAPGSAGSSSEAGGPTVPVAAAPAPAAAAAAAAAATAARPAGSVAAASPTAAVAPTATGAKSATAPTPAPSAGPTERGSAAPGSASGKAAPHAATAAAAAVATEPAPAPGTAATKGAKTSESSKDDDDDGAAGAGSARSAGSAGPGRANSGAPRGNRPLTATPSMVTGASLTAEELCAAAGLSEVELASLEGFGLIDSMQVAGLATYNEDALTVANLSAELRVFGIEPRHLRLYKNAVDREVGLIEQVIIPLLRQRNPESRQRAIDSAEQLGTLGQTMRATLLRAALRQHLGG